MTTGRTMMTTMMRARRTKSTVMTSRVVMRVPVVVVLAAMMAMLIQCQINDSFNHVFILQSGLSVCRQIDSLLQRKGFILFAQSVQDGARCKPNNKLVQQ